MTLIDLKVTPRSTELKNPSVNEHPIRCGFPVYLQTLRIKKYGLSKLSQNSCTRINTKEFSLNQRYVTSVLSNNFQLFIHRDKKKKNSLISIIVRPSSCFTFITGLSEHKVSPTSE